MSGNFQSYLPLQGIMPGYLTGQVTQLQVSITSVLCPFKFGQLVLITVVCQWLRANQENHLSEINEGMRHLTWSLGKVALSFWFAQYCPSFNAENFMSRVSLKPRQAKWWTLITSVPCDVT